jgi:hypothetical protein
MGPDMTRHHAWSCRVLLDHHQYRTFDSEETAPGPACTWNSEWAEEKYQDDGKCPRCGGPVKSFTFEA